MKRNTRSGQSASRDLADDEMHAPLLDAATVHAYREALSKAIGDLAGSPLEQPAAAAMRRALAHAPRAQAALARLRAVQHEPTPGANPAASCAADPGRRAAPRRRATAMV
jgi:hypothetical protein